MSVTLFVQNPFKTVRLYLLSNFHTRLLLNSLNNKISHLWQLDYAGYSKNNTLNIQLRFSRKMTFWTWGLIILSQRYGNSGHERV